MELELCFTLLEVSATILRKRKKRNFQTGFMSRDFYYLMKNEDFVPLHFLIIVYFLGNLMALKCSKRIWLELNIRVVHNSKVVVFFKTQFLTNEAK